MQHEVFSYAYERLAEKIASALRELDAEMLNASVRVSDVCQICQDKNGQRIIVDELRYELPGLFALVFEIALTAEKWNAVLKAAGAVCNFMKDDASIELDGFNWHGNDSGKAFFEPAIRNSRMSVEAPSSPRISLEYRIELGVNSLKGEEFKRVDKRDLRTEKM